MTDKTLDLRANLRINHPEILKIPLKLEPRLKSNFDNKL